MSDQIRKTPQRRLPPRSRSSFLTRTATDVAAQLERRLSTTTEEPQTPLQISGPSGNLREPTADASLLEPRRPELTKGPLNSLDGGKQPLFLERRSSSSRRKSGHGFLGSASLTAQMHNNRDIDGKDSSTGGPRIGSMPRPVGGHGKLGTFSGVFVPTTLNVLSILMFLRFGFILGQAGVVGMTGSFTATIIA